MRIKATMMNAETTPAVPVPDESEWARQLPASHSVRNIVPCTQNPSATKTPRSIVDNSCSRPHKKRKANHAERESREGEASLGSPVQNIAHVSDDEDDASSVPPSPSHLMVVYSAGSLVCARDKLAQPEGCSPLAPCPLLPAHVVFEPPAPFPAPHKDFTLCYDVPECTTVVHGPTTTYCHGSYHRDAAKTDRLLAYLKRRRKRILPAPRLQVACLQSRTARAP